jgi:hypothetical protein
MKLNEILEDAALTIVAIGSIVFSLLPHRKENTSGKKNNLEYVAKHGTASQREKWGIVKEEDIQPTTSEDNKNLKKSYYELMGLGEKVQRIAKMDYQTVIDSLNTPIEAAFYCTVILRYGPQVPLTESLSFSKIHQKGYTDCKGGMITAAAILNDNGFKPYGLIMKDINTKKNKKITEHAVFLFKNSDGTFGSVGVNLNDNRLFRTYETIDELVWAISKDSQSNFRKIAVIDIATWCPFYNQ